MKILLAFAAFVALCNSNAVPWNNGHNMDGESRYILMIRDNGEQELVDLLEPIDLSNTKVGSNNQYWLYTRRNPSDHQVIVYNDQQSVRQSNFGADRPTVVLIHGWLNTGFSTVNQIVRNELLAIEDYNVIIVDWSNAAQGTYVSAVGAVQSVGNFVGHFMSWLLSTSHPSGPNWNSVHVVGYDLGAHAAGIAGRVVGGRFARVTGLDPAGPLWSTNPNRLDNDVAQYVEGIHTDGFQQGIFNPVGHADFYPNGGRNPQPGCFGSACSHARAFQLFASSLSNSHLIGRQCNDLNQAQNMQCTGEQLALGNGKMNKRGTGIYALRTESSWPF